MKFAKLSLLSVLFYIAAASYSTLSSAQGQTNQPILEGYSTGTISIVPNPKLKQITIVFTSPVVLNANSNQIVFVLQTNSQAYPDAWSGTGRVLVGNCMVAVVPLNCMVVVAPEGTYKSHSLAFMFQGRPVPASIQSWKLETYDIFGIARYGEHKPLTAKQIARLENTGRLRG